MSNESLSSQYILQIMLPILRSATRLSCTISYMFWLLRSLTVFKRTTTLYEVQSRKTVFVSIYRMNYEYVRKQT
jgi:hypothetical protein